MGAWVVGAGVAGVVVVGTIGGDVVQPAKRTATVSALVMRMSAGDFIREDQRRVSLYHFLSILPLFPHFWVR